nr:acyl carrier protein [Kibdelosporangium sp. MJ126-NF4]
MSGPVLDPTIDPLVEPAVGVLVAAAGVRGHRASDLTRDHQLDKLGFDSLDRVALAVAIEHATCRTVPDLVLATAGTLGDLIDHLTTEPERTP